VTPERLREACLAALTPRPLPRVDLDHVAPIRASVTDAVFDLVALLPGAGTVTFTELTAGFGERLDVVVRFLAVLELYKRGWVDLAQPNNLAELTVWWLGSDDEAGEMAVPYNPVEEYQG
jgi:segregation and condensation protein A